MFLNISLTQAFCTREPQPHFLYVFLYPPFPSNSVTSEPWRALRHASLVTMWIVGRRESWAPVTNYWNQSKTSPCDVFSPLKPTSCCQELFFVFNIFSCFWNIWFGEFVVVAVFSHPTTICRRLLMWQAGRPVPSLSASTLVTTSTMWISTTKKNSRKRDKEVVGFPTPGKHDVESLIKYQHTHTHRHTTLKHMGISKNRGTPKWMVKIMENPIKMEDLGVPLFSETPI